MFRYVQILNILSSKYYYLDKYLFDKIRKCYDKSLKLSKSGELEITDLNRIYLEQRKLDVKLLGKGFALLDTEQWIPYCILLILYE